MRHERTVRSARRISWWAGQQGQIRLALRPLRRSPGYSLAVVVNLALGIGATTALFAALHSVVLRPLPYPDPDRLAVIEHEMPGIRDARAADALRSLSGSGPAVC